MAACAQVADTTLAVVGDEADTLPMRENSWPRLSTAVKMYCGQNDDKIWKLILDKAGVLIKELQSGKEVW